MEICALFLHHCSSAISLSEHTIRAYASDLRDFALFFENQNAGEIGKEDLRRYIRHLREERKHKEASIKRRLACLKLLFKWSLQESLIAENPFATLNEKIRLPRRLPRALDRNHISLLRKALLREGNGFDSLSRKTAIHVLLDTGMRVGELSSVRIEDISLSNRCLKVQGKGNRQRFAYLLSPLLYSALERYLAERLELGTEGKLFITASGLDLTPQRIRAALKEIASNAGIDRHLTPHMLRHTCATQWLESGLDIRYVQKLLGHQSISTTEIYTHVSDQGLREALSRAMGGR